jgi:hypothetical protein
MAIEAQLSILLQSVLTAGLAARGVTAQVQQDQQARQQGTPSAATVFFHHIGTVNVGWPEKSDVWNAGNGNFDHTETQRRESRYQIGALAPRTPGDPTLPTPADFCLAAAAVLQSDVTIATLQASSVGVQHITEIRSTYFVDDRQQNEENPTFDVILSYQDVFTTSTPKITTISETVESV